MDTGRRSGQRVGQNLQQLNHCSRLQNPLLFRGFFMTNKYTKGFIMSTVKRVSGDYTIQSVDGGNINLSGGPVVVSSALVVSVYADAAARDAAIPAPTAGTMVFVTDPGQFYGYTGTTWATLGPIPPT
jgi:hypothetical protein